MKSANILLLTNLHQRRETISRLFQRIETPEGIEIFRGGGEPSPSDIRSILSVFPYTPPYFKIVPSHPHKFWHLKIPAAQGYAIRLDGFQDVRHYLRSHFKKKGKDTTSSMARLERCFEVRYHMYHGTITQEDYRYFMGTLRTMIQKRFREREEESSQLSHWAEILETGYDLINGKKASLLVISERGNPIVISLMYHYGPVLFTYISSYDLAYSRFSPGQIKLYKQLEWCFENGYSILEMGWGDLEYKKRWCNFIYRFETRIWIPKKIPYAFIPALFIGYKKRLIAYLVRKKINVLFHTIKGKIFNSLEEDTSPDPAQVTWHKNTKVPADASPVDPFCGEYQMLYRDLYEYLYRTSTPVSEVRVSRLEATGAIFIHADGNDLLVELLSPQ